MAGSLALKSRKALVLGANPSGFALVRFLIRRGAEVVLADNRASDVVQPLVAENLDVTKFTLETGEFNPKTFEQVQLVVVTPGLPLDLKILEQARTAGIPVMSELEFVSIYTEEPIIAVAGTNGKSTTAALLGRMLEISGRTIFTNVFSPLAEYLNKGKAADYIIAVTNSFQLEGISNFQPKGVIFLNLSEDHANRYPNFETYLASYREVLKNVTDESFVAFNAQDPQVVSFVQSIPTNPAKLVFGGGTDFGPELNSSWGDKTTVSTRVNGKVETFDTKNFRLRGGHNRENLMAAAVTALHLGAKKAAVQETVDTFSALPNRVEFVRRINSVAFYNDSSGANVVATMRTLQAFHEPVILISGGRDKNGDYTPLIPHIRQRVKNLILVGEAKEKFNRAVGDYTETFLVGTVEEAILLAYQKSRSGDVILFSPGCDSTDVFVNHEERGDKFKNLVLAISQPRRPNVI